MLGPTCPGGWEYNAESNKCYYGCPFLMYTNISSSVSYCNTLTGGAGKLAEPKDDITAQFLGSTFLCGICRHF